MSQPKPRSSKITRRAAVLGGAALLSPLRAKVVSAAPPAEAITPELIAAARKEGKVVFHTAMDLAYAELLAKGFEAKFPEIKVRVERSGSERVFQRIAQEYASGIHNVDVVNTADAAHVIPWKEQGWLAPYLPEEVAKHFPANRYDPDATWVTHRIHLCTIAYNTNLVKPEDAPKSYADLLDPKWSGKMVKAHPGYSGSIMTATHQLVRELGWGYLEKLAKQKIMQVQSASDPPKKIALGERAVMADGSDYIIFMSKLKGQPVDLVYPTEGVPTITNPTCVFKQAPNPNAARLMHAWTLSAEGQQYLVDMSGQYAAHSQIKDKPGRRALADIKTFREDPAEVARMADEIKTKYALLFKV